MRNIRKAKNERHSISSRSCKPREDLETVKPEITKGTWPLSPVCYPILEPRTTTKE